MERDSLWKNAESAVFRLGGHNDFDLFVGSDFGGIVHTALKLLRGHDLVVDGDRIDHIAGLTADAEARRQSTVTFFSSETSAITLSWVLNSLIT